MVVCFTNHVLDQFLENILKDPKNEDKIVRTGGRCKNEIVKKLDLIVKNINVLIIENVKDN